MGNSSVEQEYKESVGFRRAEEGGPHCGTCWFKSTHFRHQTPETGCYLFDAFIGDTIHRTGFGFSGCEGLAGTIYDQYKRAN